MTKVSEKKRLLREAKEAGLPANEKWTVARLREEIEKAHASRDSGHTTLVQKATSLGLVVPDEWTEEQITSAIDAYEEAERDSSNTEESERAVKEWSPGSPRG